MISKNGQYVDRDVGCPVLYVADILPADRCQFAQLLLRKPRSQSGVTQVPRQGVAQLGGDRRRGPTGALRGRHVLLNNPSLACRLNTLMRCPQQWLRFQKPLTAQANSYTAKLCDESASLAVQAAIASSPWNDESASFCRLIRAFYKTLIRVDWRFIVDNRPRPCQFSAGARFGACQFIAQFIRRFVDISKAEPSAALAYPQPEPMGGGHL